MPVWNIFGRGFDSRRLHHYFNQKHISFFNFQKKKIEKTRSKIKKKLAFRLIGVIV